MTDEHDATAAGTVRGGMSGRELASFRRRVPGRTCAFCGKDLGSAFLRRRYCSDACRWNAANRRRRDAASAKPAGRVHHIPPGARRAADYPDGVVRETAVAPAITGNRVLWVLMSSAPPGSSTGPHHHGDCETALYVVRGRGRFRFGPGLAEAVEVTAGDILYLEPGTVHAEEVLGDEPLEVLIARTAEPVVVRS